MLNLTKLLDVSAFDIFEDNRLSWNQNVKIWLEVRKSLTDSEKYFIFKSTKVGMKSMKVSINRNIFVVEVHLILQNKLK